MAVCPRHRRTIDKKGVKRLMGAINFLNGFGEHTKAMVLISDIIKGKKKFVWKKECAEAWDNLMNSLRNISMIFL